MYRDHPDNILGVNTADNLFSSAAVTANADGSMIERQEYIQQQVAAISTALPGCFGWGIAPSGTDSTTEVVIAALAGYGDDFFNDKYYMQILKNADSAGNAPEKQIRKITDYATATGTFTCDAFGAAIGASDICLILHESVVAIGRDDNDNIIATTNVAANADGSILERLEYLQSELGASVGASISTDIAAIKAETAEIKAGGGIGSGIARKTVTFSDDTTDISLFTVTGDVIVRLAAVCTTNVESSGGCNIGVDAGAEPIIADTDCTTLEAGDIWHDASPDKSVEAITVLKEFIIANGVDITLDIQSEKKVDSGVINFYCIWTALSATGAVVATA
ncbi:MAG: hypothetical protein WCY59_01570 [Anaerovoracaceae bacterium]|nr:hypothetical protein [Dehalococcoidia bacterium]